MQLKRARTIWTLVGCAAVCLVFGVLFLFDPAHSAFYPVCWFHELTGLNCPGCGSLRAAHHLLHGRVVTAFNCNPLLVISIPLAAGFLLTKSVNMWFGGRTSVESGKGRFYWLILLVLVVFGVVRNLPFAAFEWMSP